MNNDISYNSQAPLQPSADQHGLPLKRPDGGGTVASRSIDLFINHFRVRYDGLTIIIHYDVDVTFFPSDGGAPMKIALRKSETRSFLDQLIIKNQRFPVSLLSNSAIKLPERDFTVVVSEGKGVRSGSYRVTIKAVSALNLSKLGDYLRGNLTHIPRIQEIDLVMKENPLRYGKRFHFGRCFYPSGDGGVKRRRRHQTLEHPFDGLKLYLDYCVLSFRESLPVIEFLKQHVRGFTEANDVKRLRGDIEKALKGLLVKVNHRLTNEKYTIAGLAPEDACDSWFDREVKKTVKRTNVLEYFKDKWKKDVEYKNIPCLELGKNNKSNKVPMEFCVLVEGQRFPTEILEKKSALLFNDLTLLEPFDRGGATDKFVQDIFGCYWESDGIKLRVNMTEVKGRVIGAPELKIGASRSVKVDKQTCQWNLFDKSFVDGKSLDRWALIDFTEGDRYNRLQKDAFVNNLIGRCGKLGIKMTANHLAYRLTGMHELSSVNGIETLLKNVVMEAGIKDKVKLQMIFCVMPRQDSGYKYLKLVSETKIGVMTQCCLSESANKGQDQYFANLCLKINAKLGGSNFELMENLLHSDAEDHVMFIGAYVNHPAPGNTSCPSIAAVVGTVNWPAANRYAARFNPQENRCEKINNFGAMCQDLVKTYVELNKVKPKKIVVFRDGVSEGQFGMVLDQELGYLKDKIKEIYTGDYQPPITVIVAEKRHQTRLFVVDEIVPSGTVVDTEIVHPHDFHFYLCSHNGGLGTSKPTHYYVHWDENFFSSDALQKLIYDMCFTFVRCTKPVSLVPPVYYADLAAHRGRMFQEAAASQNALPHNQNHYSLHSDLENTMFFV